MDEKFLEQVYSTEFFKLPRTCFYKFLSHTSFDEISFSKLRDMILNCPVLSFAILKFANSKEFGFSGKILTITEALSLIEIPVAKNYLLSFKEYNDDFKLLNICNGILSAANKIKRFTIKNSIKQWEFFYILGLLKNIPTILYINFFKQHSYGTFVRSIKENLTATMLKKCRFPVLFYQIYKGTNNKRYKYIKEFIDLTFKYYKCSYPHYLSVVEREIPDIVQKLKKYDNIKEVMYL